MDSPESSLVAAPEEDVGQFYTKLTPRSVIVLPLLLLMLLNPIYHFVMVFLIQIDLLLGNFVAWLFFGEFIAGGIGLFAVTISSIPIILLPHLWRSPSLWGIAKIGIFILAIILTTVISSLVSAGALGLLNIFADLRATLWWGELWGVISPG